MAKTIRNLTPGELKKLQDGIRARVAEVFGATIAGLDFRTVAGINAILKDLTARQDKLVDSSEFDDYDEDDEDVKIVRSLLERHGWVRGVLRREFGS